MSRWEFMRQLEELLTDISPSEREEALQYYNDYFNDAGRENEKEVIAALGTPEQVASIVKEGLGDSSNTGEFTETGFRSGMGQSNAVMKTAQTKTEDIHTAYAGNQNANQAYQGGESKGEAKGAAKEKKGMPVWAIVLLVIGGILLSPVILSLFASVAAALLGVICGIIGIVAGVGIAALGLYIAAIALVIAGFGCILVHPISGIGLIGAGLICAAIGILFMLLTVLLAGKCIPGICQGIAYIWKKLFGKKGGA